MSRRPRLLRRALGRGALRVAQTPPGGWLVRFACARASRLLPVTRVAETPRALVFRHPAPEAPDHLVVVPKVALRDLCALVARDRLDVWTDVIAAARLAPARVAGERVLTVNVGARQQVAQLHGHVLPVTAARLLLAQVRRRYAVDLGAPGDVRAVLAAAVAELAGCDRALHGSVLLRGFATPGGAELLVCIAPQDGAR